MPAKKVPPVTLSPFSILVFTGFQILEPGGASNAVPYFQFLSLNRPLLTAPGSERSMALLSTPAGAVSGNLSVPAAALLA